MSGSGNITIKRLDIPFSDFEFDVSPQFSETNVSVTLYNSDGDVISVDTGKIQVFGKTVLSEYFTPIQNGIFYLDEPDSVALASIPIERIRIRHEDTTDTSMVKVSVRQYND